MCLEGLSDAVGQYDGPYYLNSTSIMLTRQSLCTHLGAFHHQEQKNEIVVIHEMTLKNVEHVPSAVGVEGAVD